MTDFASFKTARDAYVARLGNVLYERSPTKIARPDASKLAKRVAKKIAIRETHVAASRGLRGYEKQKATIKRFKFEMVDVIKAATTGDFELSVACVMGICKKQAAARNASNLEKHTTAVLSIFSPSELAQLSIQNENTNGKAGLAPNHVPANQE